MNVPMRMFDFENESLRATMIDGEAWLVGRDICRMLQLENASQALSRLDDDERRDTIIANDGTLQTVTATDAMGRARASTLVSEPGFWRLVSTSRTEVAGRVMRWVFHEVLPALRKTGQYTMSEHVGRTTRIPPEDEPIDLDAAPLGQIRIAVSLLREVRIVFGIPHARLVARHIGVTSTVLRLDQYREIGESVDDDIASFGRDRLIAVDKATATAADIYKSYVKWCRNNEIAPASQTMLGRRLRLMGFNKQQSSGTVRYLGVALSDASE